MTKNSIPRTEVGVLAGLAGYVVVTFLPWSHHITIADTSVFAILLLALMVIAPVCGLTLALAGKDDD